MIGQASHWGFDLEQCSSYPIFDDLEGDMASFF